MFIPRHTAVLPASPVERLVRIIDDLCAAVAARGAGGVLTVPLFFLLWRRLRHMAVRATRAAARVAAGIQPIARPRPATPRPSRPQPLRLPRGFAWVVRAVPGTAGYGTQLQALLAEPEMARLAQAPAMRRLLNPLCQMLGTTKPPPAPSRPAAAPRPAASAQASDDQPAAVAPPPPMPAVAA